MIPKLARMRIFRRRSGLKQQFADVSLLDGLT